MRAIDADEFKMYMRNALEETRNCYPDGGEWAETITEEFCKDIDKQPTIEPQIKPITYHDCSNAMMMMWMDKIVTDGEYNKIMDRLNKFEIEKRKTEKK